MSSKKKKTTTKVKLYRGWNLTSSLSTNPSSFLSHAFNMPSMESLSSILLVSGVRGLSFRPFSWAKSMIISHSSSVKKFGISVERETKETVYDINKWINNTVEVLLTDTLVSAQLYLQPFSQNPVLLNSHTNLYFLYSRNSPAPVTNTFFASQGWLLKKASTVYGEVQRHWSIEFLFKDS